MYSSLYHPSLPFKKFPLWRYVTIISPLFLPYLSSLFPFLFFLSYPLPSPHLPPARLCPLIQCFFYCSVLLISYLLVIFLVESWVHSQVLFHYPSIIFTFWSINVCGYISGLLLCPILSWRAHQSHAAFAMSFHYCVSESGNTLPIIFPSISGQLFL